MIQEAGKMNNATKSIAYAFVANGVQIYFSEDDDEFLASKLVCAECGGPWYMNLTECLLCGAINPFLYRCSDCGEFVSITNSGGTCPNCKSTELYMTCPNEDCISNTNKDLSSEIKKYGGVFNKESGLLISQQYCLYCGSQLHTYKNFKIKVITTTSDVVGLEDILPDRSRYDSNLYLIIRKKNDTEILYGVYKLSELNEKKILLTNLYDSISKVVEFLYPIKTKKENDLL